MNDKNLIQILELGISAYLYRKIEDIDASWFTIQDISQSLIIGKSDLTGEKILFSIDEIVILRGNLDWNIKHLNVNCSYSLIEEKTVGYFYNGMVEIPNHFGRIFFSLSERDRPKSNVKMKILPLRELLKWDSSILPYLEEFAYNGYKRANNGTFIPCKNETNKDIYPSMFG